MIESKEEIINLMKDGYKLKNFGSGYFLRKKNNPYAPIDLPVKQELITELESENKIKLYNTSSSRTGELA